MRLESVVGTVRPSPTSFLWYSRVRRRWQGPPPSSPADPHRPLRAASAAASSLQRRAARATPAVNRESRTFGLLRWARRGSSLAVAPHRGRQTPMTGRRSQRPCDLVQAPTSTGAHVCHRCLLPAALGFSAPLTLRRSSRARSERDNCDNGAQMFLFSKLHVNLIMQPFPIQNKVKRKGDDRSLPCFKKR